MQAKEVSPGMQEVMPGRAHGQIVHRGRPREQDRVHL